MTPSDALAAEAALVKQDPVLGALIKLQQPVFRPRRDDYFASLCRAIIGQQVSVAAAAAIYSRFESATALDPTTVQALSEVDAKTIGLSRMKASYLHDLAAHFDTSPTVYDHLDKLSDDDVIRELVAIKGVGIWTAQMFLMFTLGRPDVFAPADVGLQRAIVKLYGLPSTPPAEELEHLAERWRPYRTVASWHLWESLHNDPL
jgi:DNA-3-methyladenine glycosylase II